MKISKSRLLSMIRESLNEKRRLIKESINDDDEFDSEEDTEHDSSNFPGLPYENAMLHKLRDLYKDEDGQVTIGSIYSVLLKLVRQYDNFDIEYDLDTRVNEYTKGDQFERAYPEYDYLGESVRDVVKWFEDNSHHEEKWRSIHPEIYRNLYRKKMHINDFDYSRKVDSSKINADPTYPPIDMDAFFRLSQRYGWLDKWRGTVKNY
jgi:hypothetical protein